MSSDDERGGGFSLRRWSARKHAAARATPSPEPEVEASPTVEPVEAAVPDTARPLDAEPVGAPLPPVESLTPESDFVPFMRRDVDETVKRAALKKLFSDPRFNMMDGLDVYIDDYTKPDPIEPSLLAKLAHARYIFDPPATRVNERGFVEDVSPEPPEVAPAVALADSDPQDVVAGSPPPTEVEPVPQQVELPLPPPDPAEPSQ